MDFLRVTPESVGISSSAIGELIEKWNSAGIEMHSFMLLRHGKICAEGWWNPYTPNEPHIMFSFSKSLTSTAIGFAEQEGVLSLDEKLVDLFPNQLPDVISENLKKATIKDLLTMSCGHETEIPNLGFDTQDWISAFLNHEFKFEPGTKFHYNTTGTNMLCAILQNKTGQSLTEFLRPRLIEPLGMSNIKCAPTPNGVELGGAGYKLTTEDMALFMTFVASKGIWDGKQLLQKDWFDRATAKQIETDNREWGIDWVEGYCFQYWRCIPRNTYRADGAFGQFGIVMEDYDAVLIVTSSSANNTQALLSAVWDILIPAMKSESLPENELANTVLLNTLQNLEISPILSTRNTYSEAKINKKIYSVKAETTAFTNIIGGPGRFDLEDDFLQSISFSFSDEVATLTCVQNKNKRIFNIGINSRHVLTEIDGVIYGAVGRWRTPDKFEIAIRNTQTAMGKLMLFTFEGTNLTLTVDPSIPLTDGLADPLVEDIHFVNDFIIDISDIVIETSRLIIRPFKESDLEDFYGYCSVEGVGEMAGWNHHKSIEESREILDMFLSKKEVFAVVSKADNKVIGSLGLHRSWTNDDPEHTQLKAKEIGYVLSKDYWGRGLMPEAVKALIETCFDKYDLDALSIGHFITNSQSKRVIEKNGFKFVKQDKFYSAQMDKYFDDAKYILLKNGG